MSETLRNTRWLFAVLVLVLAVDVWAHLRGPGELAALPQLAPFDAEEPLGLRLSQAGEVVEIARGEGGWQVTAPYDHPADTETIDALLALLGRGVSMEARVDDGGHDRYGLDGGEAILVEVEGAAGALARLYVGANVTGGSTFVRFPDAEPVYRARIGGRSRYERPPGAWRDRRVLDIDAHEVVRLSANALSFVREPVLGADGRPAPGTWELRGDPAFDVDVALLDAAVRTLATLRADDIVSPDYPAGLETPDVRLELALDSGETHTLDVATARGQAWARRAAGEPVLRIPVPLAQVLAAPLSGWRNRTLLVVPTEQMAALILELGGAAAVLERDPRSGVWRMIRPANVDVDARQIDRIAAFVGRLRVEEFVETGTFTAPSRLTVVATDGARQVLEVGDVVPGRSEGAEARYVRLEGADRIGVLPARTWSAIRQAFAR